MNKFLIGAAVAGAFVSSSYAADLPMKAHPAPAAVGATIANWSGCYIGGGGGGIWERGDAYTTTGSSGFFTIPPGVTATIPGGQAASGSFSGSAGMGSVYGGCNYQMGVWVVGAEGDWSTFDINASALSGAPLASSAGPIGFTATQWTQSQKNIATARARVGYAFTMANTNVLVYATGGAAWTKITTQLAQPGTAFAESQSDRLTGWVVGAGTEFMLPFPGWMLRAEYLHVQFPSFTTFSSPTTSAQPAAVNGYLTNLNGKVSNDIVRVGLGYKFWNWAGR